MSKQEVIEEVFRDLWFEFADEDGEFHSAIMPRILETLKSEIPKERSEEIIGAAFNKEGKKYE